MWIDQFTLTETFPPKLSQIADFLYVDQDMDTNFSDLDDKISQLEWVPSLSHYSM